MLKFLTTPETNSETYFDCYVFHFYVKPDLIGVNAEEASKYYLNKLRNMLLELNKTIPRFANAKWYNPLPYEDTRYVKNPEKYGITAKRGISLIDQYDEFIADVLEQNQELKHSITIDFTWDGIHPLTYPAFFSTKHTINPQFEYLTMKDYIKLYFYVPKKFNYHQDWEYGFSLEELVLIVKTLSQHYDIIHADMSVPGFVVRTVPKDSSDYYSDTYGVFKHRLGSAWMMVLDKALSAEQVPEAAKVIPLAKGRTLVMSVADTYFSSYNPEHVLKANLLELRLHELGALRSVFATE